MWVEQGVGMSEANDLALRNPEPPLGGEAHTDLLNAVCPYNIIFNLFFTRYFF
jgi:hypothetical protein